MLSKPKPRCFSLSNQWTNQIARDPHLWRGTQATLRPGGKFSRVTNWVCSRRLYVQRHAFIFPFYLCSTFIFTISASSSYTLLPDFLPFLLPSHSFSLQTSPFSQYEVLHSPQRAWPRGRCRCPTDYSRLDSRFLHAGYFNFRLLDSGAELPRRM
jgi:hypothetical protein